jgi:hypothetical protein
LYFEHGASSLTKSICSPIIAYVLDNLLPGESTAQAIARGFEKRGTHRDDIGSQDLMPFYAAMNPINARVVSTGGSRFEFRGGDMYTTDSAWAVIVETREHPSLEFIVCQFARNLNIGIQIFHGPENRRFITDSAIGRLIDNGQVHLTDLGVNKLSNRYYNEMLLSPSFWDAIYGRGKILIFQTDSILCDNSAYSLDDFIQFDYIGSKWGRYRPIGILVDGGSGGLSLRDWDWTTKCLDRFPPIPWPGGEDGYFAFHMDLMGRYVARARDCEKFSTQMNFACRSFGAHQIQRLGESALQRFLEYCPEARVILN